ncbi:cytochrome P450 family protein [Ceratobasidium sp. AG-Ba]|nr:cytochrome P450 family protein [Ceratobasidium sp. AG-Ba]
MELICMTLWQHYVAYILIAWSTIWVAIRVYNLYFHPLKRIPGPALPAATSFWIRWQRWQGKLSFTADDLLAVYGPVIRIAPNMVLVNDPPLFQLPLPSRTLTRLQRLFELFDQMDIARPRRRPVMMATTTRHLKYWLPLFETYLGDMISNIMRADGENQVILGGASVRLNGEDFPQVVGEYNFLVVWRLVFPEWMINWLRYGPSSKARYRIKSSDLLYKAEPQWFQWTKKKPPVFTSFLLKAKRENVSSGHIQKLVPKWPDSSTETTSSTIAFIMYELAKNPGLVERLYSELQTVSGNSELDTLKLLDATIKEGLRFRPPVALTGSRTVGKGGMELLGYFVPEGTVLTTQALSICRQRPDLFPNADVFDPGRWLEAEYLDERRKLLVPFGVGTRRCPGGNLAIYQMRLIIGGLIRNFKIAVAPETTPKSMAPFEANGFRSRYDQCHLIFTPRNKAQVEFEK